MQQAHSSQLIQQGLQHLLDQLLVNETGVLNDVDSEYLHDYRVALRKLRTLLSQLQTLFSEPQRQQFLEEFAWLAEQTNRVRDLDVQLAMFSHWQKLLGKKSRAAILPFLDYLLSEREQAYKHLHSALHSSRYAELKQSWLAYLQTLAQQDFSMELVPQALEKYFRKVISRCQQLRSRSSLAEFHKLRIAEKKLRYLLDFFSVSMNEEPLRALMTGLKKFQEKFGALHDLQAMNVTLDNYLQHCQPQGSATQTAVKLQKKIQRKLEQSKSAAHKAAKKFSGKKTINRYKQLWVTQNQ